MKYVEVVFNIPVNKTFYYSVSPISQAKKKKQVEECVAVGMRVSAPFGKRKLTGCIVAILDGKPETDFEIKEVERIIDKEPLFDSSFYDLAKWVSQMYICSAGEALFSMLPSGRREKEFLLELLLDEDDKALKADKKIILNEEQQTAVERISQSSNQLFYLYGVTGSGKTEVFLHMAELAIKEGKSVIYLVPEIALTHQLTDYVTLRFGNNVAVIHSGLTPSQKLGQWRKIQKGDAKIILGARSAVFAPVLDPGPGLIIIDEENETSYKASSSPRYHARQTAMYRIKKSGGKLIMGSATPSVEAWQLMEKGEIEKLKLVKSAAGGAFAAVEIVDMAGEGTLISRRLSEQIREVTSKKGQVILFLNRRGFFYNYHCFSCTFELKCKQCSVPLTYHKEEDRLICHYCGYNEKPSQTCPSCGSVEVGYSGCGTEKIESDVKKLFPYLKAERADRDSIKKSSDLKDIFTRFYKGETDILLGTQIIAKGLNFPGVKLVGIVMADTALQLPDFRAAERTFSLITQVAGRTGRFAPEGKVIIQTFRPNNYAVRLASLRKSDDFYKTEIENRKILGFPPFSRAIRVIFRSRDSAKSSAASHDFYKLLELYNASVSKNSLQGEVENSTEIEEAIRILGPAECPVSLLAGNYRYHLLVISDNFKLLHRAVSACTGRMKSAMPSAVYMEIDVDPLSLM